jgi:hypothetical protein
VCNWLCCCNVTDCCSGSDYTTSTTQADQAQAMDTWFNAANEADVNVIHYQWGQDDLTPSAAGPIRPQSTTTSTTETGNTLGVSPDDGYAA